jgi:PhnB protein
MTQTLVRTTEETRTSARREDLQSVTPHLVCAGAAEAIEFYKRAFGAVELMRLPGRDGRLMHGSIAIGGGRVMLVDEMPECGALSPRSLKGTPVTVHLYVDDVDAFVDRAVKAGATLRMPVTDMFWGDRVAEIEDPSGHRWSIATRKEDLSPKEVSERAQAWFASKGKP